MIFFSCDNATSWFCGDIQELEKTSLDEIETKYGDYLEVELIPCEYLYANIFLKEEHIDTLKIKMTHDILYNPQTSKGWQSLNLYDSEKKYLFSHHFNGKTNVKKSQADPDF